LQAIKVWEPVDYTIKITNELTKEMVQHRRCAAVWQCATGLKIPKKSDREGEGLLCMQQDCCVCNKRTTWKGEKDLELSVLSATRHSWTVLSTM
jgi:hypothetical protein